MSKYKLLFFCICSIFLYGCSEMKSRGEESTASFLFSNSWNRYQNNPILNPRNVVSPASGTKTLGHMADPCILWDEPHQTWRIYWSMWDIHNDENNLTASGIIGATSDSTGKNFKALDVISLSQEGNFGTSSVETCDVVMVPDVSSSSGYKYYMYFSASDSLDNEDPKHKMGLALSDDGIEFSLLSAAQSKNNVPGLLFTIEDLLGGGDVPGNFVTDPTVIYQNGTFQMWAYCAQTVPEAEGGICYLTSLDGINWNYQGLTVGTEAIAAAPIQPTIIFNTKLNRYEMLVVLDTIAEEQEIHDFNTNFELRVKGWYFLTSSNGVNWTLGNNQNRVFEENLNLPYENSGLATGGDMEVQGDNLFFLYPSFTTRGGSVFGNLLNWPLNFATKKLDDQ